VAAALVRAAARTTLSLSLSRVWSRRRRQPCRSGDLWWWWRPCRGQRPEEVGGGLVGWRPERGTAAPRVSGSEKNVRL
jgi:hypothetical protein